MKLKAIFLVLVMTVIILGCSAKTTKNGDTVSVLYSANLEDGTLIDDNNGNPFEFTLGAGEVVTGFNYAVLGMKIGEEKTVTITPEQGYGLYDNSRKIMRSVEELENAGITPELGITVYSTVNDNVVRGVITENNGTHVMIDFNHPLAGKTLIFKIELVDIISHTESAIN